MKKVKINKIKKDYFKKEVPKLLSESNFWKRLALQQQVFIHAKNNT